MPALFFFFQTISWAARGLRSSPTFFLSTTCLLAASCAAVTVTSIFVDALFIQRIPVARPDDISLLHTHNPKHDLLNGRFSYPFYRDLRRQARNIGTIFAFSQTSLTISAGSIPEQVIGEVVSGTYFSTLGVTPHSGRLLSDDDDGPEQTSNDCVISYRLWHSLYGGGPALGRRITLNGHPFVVVGILPPSFYGLELNRSHDVFVPLSSLSSFADGRRDDTSWHPIMIGIRTATAIDRTVLASQLGSLGLSIINQSTPDVAEDIDSFRALPGARGVNDPWLRLRPALLAISGLVLLGTLIAGTSLASLFSARTIEKRAEMAVRLSVGARPLDLTFQVAAEAVLCAIAASVLGLLFVTAVVQHIVALIFYGDSHLVFPATLQTHAIALCIGASLMFAIAGSVIPSLSIWTIDVREALASQRSPSARYRWLRHTLLVVQAAASIAILFVAALLAGTMRHLGGAQVGFSAERVTGFTVNPSDVGYRGQATLTYLAAMLDQLRHSPSGQVSAVTSAVPLYGLHYSSRFRTRDRDSRTLRVDNEFVFVSDHYFSTLGIRVLAGRDFTPAETRHKAPVAIISKECQRVYFGGDNPLGREVRWGKDNIAQVIGISNDVKYDSPQEAKRIVVYLPLSLAPDQPWSVVARGRGKLRDDFDQMATMASQIDRRVPLYGQFSLQERANQVIARERLLTFLASALGVWSAILSAIGLYSFIRDLANNRAREIAIRVALGARRVQLVVSFLGYVTSTVLLGTIIGCPLGLFMSHAMQHFLYGISPAEPTILVMTVFGFVTVAFLSAWIALRDSAIFRPVTVLQASR